MKRRVFLSFPIIVSFVSFLSCGKKEPIWDVIASVQNDLFPRSKKYPSADTFGAIRYLKMVSRDASFDRDDLDFIFEGAKHLQEQGYKSTLSKDKKQKILHTFKESRYGANWISIMIHYGIEALFSDPIYGGNKEMIGWKSFHHHAGEPRPVKRFGGKRDV